MRVHILFIAMCITGSAVAGSACDNPKNDFDGLYCLNKIYQESDKELNTNYKLLTTLLDTSAKTQLKRSQLEWIQNRNSECSRRDGNAFFVNLECANNMTIGRAQFLQDRIRECKSSGCLNSRL